MLDASIIRRAQQVLELCRAAGLKVATVESCTGGLIIGALTACAGSSDVVERGFVTYSYESKTETVGVPADLLEAHGAVNEDVARAMAEGGVRNSHADIVVSATGVAGPGGGTEAKPVGLVHMALASRDGTGTVNEEHHFEGDRAAVRQATVLAALEMIARRAGG